MASAFVPLSRGTFKTSQLSHQQRRAFTKNMSSDLYWPLHPDYLPVLVLASHQAGLSERAYYARELIRQNQRLTLPSLRDIEFVMTKLNIYRPDLLLQYETPRATSLWAGRIIVAALQECPLCDQPLLLSSSPSVQFGNTFFICFCILRVVPPPQKMIIISMPWFLSGRGLRPPSPLSSWGGLRPTQTPPLAASPRKVGKTGCPPAASFASDIPGYESTICHICKHTCLHIC